jgi:hypothetical protein
VELEGEFEDKVSPRPSRALWVSHLSVRVQIAHIRKRHDDELHAEDQKHQNLVRPAATPCIVGD